MNYIPNVAHRNRTPRKSQWTIPISAEVRSFNLCVDRVWYKNLVGWSLHLDDDEFRPNWLGLTQDGQMKTFIAKFIGTTGGIGMAIWLTM